MPELPEVETVRRGLEPHLTGKTLLLHLIVPIYACHSIHARLDHWTQMYRTTPWEIHMVDLENGKTLVIHLGMSGSFAINPQNKPHDHVEFHMNAHIVYNDRRFGMMYFVDTGLEPSPIRIMGWNRSAMNSAPHVRDKLEIRQPL